MELRYGDGKCQGPECFPSPPGNLAAWANLGSGSGVSFEESTSRKLC